LGGDRKKEKRVESEDSYIKDNRKKRIRRESG